MALKLITPPADLLPLALAKQHLRVDHDDEDALIALYLAAAIGHIEGPDGLGDGLCLMPQTWELVFDAFPDCGRPLKIPLGPLISVASVKYIDPATMFEATLGVDAYEVDTESNPGWVVPVAGWPAVAQTVNAVRVRFTAGHALGPADSVTVPPPLRSAVLLALADLYENRESTEALSPAVAANLTRLVLPYRVNWSF